MKPKFTNVVLGFFFSLVTFVSSAQVSGRVYQDYNGNGSYDTNVTLPIPGGTTIPTAIDKGVAGVTVTAYDPSGAVAGTATTGADGTYSIAGASGPVRVEFTAFPADYNSSPSGANSGTSVQFVTAPATDVNLGINRSYDYCTNDPVFATNCYWPLASDGEHAAKDVLVTIPNASGTSTYLNGVSCFGSGPCPTGYNMPAPTHLATNAQMGSTFGLAWQASKNQLFAATYIKQFTDVGPQGTGAIYRVDMTNPAAPVVMSGAPNTPTGPIDLNLLFGANTTGADPFTPYPDYASDADKARVGDAVFNAGFADIDVTPDQKTLLALSYADKKVYCIPIDGSAITATSVTSTVIPTIAGASIADMRPTAIGMNNGKIYIAVQSGFKLDPSFPYSTGIDVGNSSSVRYQYHMASNETAIFEYNPATKTFAATPVLQYNWRYGGDWLDYFAGSMISDIVFDASGAMVLAVRNMGNDLVGGTQGGRFLRACPDGTGWKLNNDGTTCGTPANNATANGNFSNMGAFYNQIDPVDGGLADGNGGLAQIPGAPYTVSTNYDPFTEYSAGLRWLNNTDGTTTKTVEIVPFQDPVPIAGVEVFDNKAGVLGEVEVLCPPAPIEIGNRVWVDTDKDGIQDAGEAALAGVTVTLCDASGAPIAGATATTDANGSYFFSSAAGTNTGSNIYGLGLKYSTDYVLKFPTSTAGKALTTKDLGANDLADSDAGTDGKIAFKTGTIGQNNHTFDVGYIESNCVVPTAITIAQTPATCTGATANNDGKITITSATGADKCGISTAGAATYDGPDYTAATAYAANKVAIATAPNAGATYIIRLFNADNTCFKDTTVTVAAVVCTPAGCTAPTALSITQTPPTCTTTTANNDGKITIVSATGADKCGISTLGATAYDGPDYTTATAYAANKVAISNIPNTGGTYIVRLFNASNTCFKDSTIVVSAVPCGSTPTCTPITLGPSTLPEGQVGVPYSVQITATGGTSPYTFAWGVGSTGTLPAGLSMSSTGLVSGTPTSTGSWSVKLFVTDTNMCPDTLDPAVVNVSDPGTPCTKPAAGTDVNVCLPKTSVNLMDATATQNWSALASNPTAATIDPATGVVAGLAVGTYSFVLAETGTTCKDTVNIIVADSTKAFICTGESYTLTAQAGLTNIQWKQGDGVTFTDIPGANAADYVATTPGIYIYTGKDATGCDIELCCPVTLIKCPVGSLGDLVWKDTNNNGVQDAGEAGVPNVIIELFKDGVSVKKDTTDASGLYTFTNLVAGTYCIKVDTTTLPADCHLSTKPDTGTDNTKDSDVQPATGKSDNYVIDPTDPTKKDIPTVDVALFTPALGSLGDLVWKDADNDGVQDATEVGAAGIVVELYNGTTLVKKDTTDASGKYLFTDLPAGTYCIKIDPTKLPAGCTISTKQDTPGDDTKDSDVASTGKSGNYVIDPTDPLKKDILTVDAALYSPLGSLGDLVWKDTNNNGVQDAGEAGVPNVIIELFKDGVSVKKDTTDASGLYTFTNLVAGTYCIKVDTTTLPADCHLSKLPNTGDDTKDSDVLPTTGKSGNYVIDPTDPTKKDIPTVDVALYTPALGSLGDLVWKDADNDGVQDAGEAGVPGVTIALYKNGTLVKKDTTDANGKYLFTQLTAGTYCIKVDTTTIPADCHLSMKPNTGADNAVDSDVLPTTGKSDDYIIEPTDPTKKDILTVDAALYAPKGSLGDLVWKDTDNDGVQDATETGVSGITVELYKNGALAATTVTDANGLYLFNNLDAGTYCIKIAPASLPAGCTLSTKQDTPSDDAKDSDVNATTGKSGNYVINPTDPTKKDILTVDAALYSPLGSLGDLVWKDTDNDGVQDAGETGVPGIVIELYKGTTLVSKDTTNSAGMYLFSNLTAGTYCIKVVPGSIPAGCTLSTKQDTPSDDAKDSDVNATTGKSGNYVIDPTDPTKKDIMTVDAALYSPKGSLGDLVWKDTDNDGVQDAGEAGVSGVTVELYKAGVKVATAYTDATGYYNFNNLDAGTYCIKVVTTSLPAGCTLSNNANAGSDDTKDSDVNPTTAKSGDYIIDPTDPAKKDIPTVDVALFTPLGSIGNLVWKDTDADGVQDPSEAPVNGVKVILWSATVTGSPLAKLDSTTTVSGGYLFDELPKGDYIVQFDLSTAPADCKTFTAPNSGSDATDSDANSNGFTAVVKLDPAKGGIDKDNPTVDAGLLASIKHDLALLKTVNTNFVPKAGQPVTFTISLINQGKTTVSGVEVLDTLASGFSYVSHTAPAGTTYNPTTGIWNIGTLQSTTDTLKLTITAKVLLEGVQFNKAEIHAMNGKDEDSAPNNNSTNEDDQASVCVTVPIEFCDNKPIELQIAAPAGFTSYTWYRNGVQIAGQSTNTYTATQEGDYTFVVSGGTVGTCQGSNCCPVRIVKVACPCPEPPCVPFKVQKTKRATYSGN